jgi:hypothetical protein
MHVIGLLVGSCMWLLEWCSVLACSKRASAFWFWAVGTQQRERGVRNTERDRARASSCSSGTRPPWMRMTAGARLVDGSLSTSVWPRGRAGGRATCVAQRSVRQQLCSATGQGKQWATASLTSHLARRARLAGMAAATWVMRGIQRGAARRGQEQRAITSRMLH